MARPLRNLFESLLGPATDAYGESCWCPAADIYRGRRGWLVKLDLAGVRPEDIQLTVQGRHLVVRGVRRDLSVIEGQQAYSMEISYNRFERRVELPCELDSTMIRHDYCDGMLLVTLATERLA